MSSQRLRIFDCLLDALTSLAFVVGVALPLIAARFWPTPFNEFAEGRHAAPPPEWNKGINAELPGQIEHWFSDHFGFRADLVRLANITRIRIGVSPSPQVIVGKDGFFFFAGARSLEQYRRLTPFTNAELGEWRSRLQARRDWLALRGIYYLVVFLPNKETIYPEKMPRSISRAPRLGRLDQLCAELRTSSTVEAVDVRDALIEARQSARVYHFTDTHWNGVGAFAAYRVLAERLHDWFPAIVPIDRSATLTSSIKRPGDLGGMLGLPDDVFESDYVDVVPRRAREREIDPPAGVPPDPSPYTKPRAFAVDDPALPRLLAFRDSFFTGMIPMLAENFRHSLILSGHGLDRALIELERPNVVIEEFIEREIMLGAPVNAPAFDDPNGALSPSEK